MWHMGEGQKQGQQTGQKEEVALASQYLTHCDFTDDYNHIVLSPYIS